MKNSNNQVVSFSSDEKFLDKVGLGHDEENDELYVRGLGGFTGDNYTTATSLQEVISDNEFVTAAALNELNSNKLDASAATGFMTSAQVETQITGKNYVTSAQVETQITGKNYATVSQIPNVGDYFDGAEYDSENVRINFKHGDTVKAYIDAAAFIKDGMVSDVEIDTPTAGTYSGVECLVVTFNTDAEKSVIEIPLNEIFDPSNYYNKTEVDSEIEAIYDVIEDNEYVIATALNNLNDNKLDVSAMADFATPADVEAQITSKNYITSAQAETQITGKNYVTSAQVETQITGKGYITSADTGFKFYDVTIQGNPGAESITNALPQGFNISIRNDITNNIVPVLRLHLTDGSVVSLPFQMHGDFQSVYVFTSVYEQTVMSFAVYDYADDDMETDYWQVNYARNDHTHSNYMTSAQVETQITGKGYITGYTESDPTVPSWAKAANKPSYTASEVGALATGTTLDGIADGSTRKLSNYSLTSHTHSDYVTSAQVETQITGKGYITGYTESDPTVPSWAKAASKPTYTASEVGALASGTTLDGIADGSTRKLSNYSLTSHTHSNYVTSGQVETQIAGRVLPTVTAADNGKVLQVVNGAWALVTPSTVYTGENTPPSSLGNDGDIYLQTS